MCVHVSVQGVPGVPQTENLGLWYDSEGYVMGKRELLTNTRKSASRWQYAAMQVAVIKWGKVRGRLKFSPSKITFRTKA